MQVPTSNVGKTAEALDAAAQFTKVQPGRLGGFSFKKIISSLINFIKPPSIKLSEPPLNAKPIKATDADNLDAAPNTERATIDRHLPCDPSGPQATQSPRTPDKSRILSTDRTLDKKISDKQKNIYNEIFVTEKDYHKSIVTLHDQMEKLLENKDEFEQLVNQFNSDITNNDPDNEGGPEHQPQSITRHEFEQCLTDLNELVKASKNVLDLEKDIHDPDALIKFESNQQNLVDAAAAMKNYIANNNSGKTSTFLNYLHRKNEPFKKSWDSNKNLKLPGSELIKPIQRGPRYQLLLTDLQKTKENSIYSDTSLKINNLLSEADSQLELYNNFPKLLSKNPIKSLYNHYSSTESFKNFNGRDFENAVRQAKTLNPEKIEKETINDKVIIKGGFEVKQYNDFEKIRSYLNTFIKEHEGQDENSINLELMKKLGIDSGNPPKVPDDFPRFIQFLREPPPPFGG